jgi:hypothetical protein
MLAVRKIALAVAPITVLLLLCSCSQPSQPSAGNEPAAKAAEPAAPAGPVTAKTAYWEMHKAAHQWAPDVVVLRLTPKDVPGLATESGKASVWEGTFASSDKHAFCVFTYAVAAQPPDIYKGVTVGSPVPWAGETREVMSIDMSQVKVDSDAAYAAAAGDGETWLKKNPGKKLANFQLGYGYSFPAPVWYVLWGNQKSGYLAYVNATTGKMLKK